MSFCGPILALRALSCDCCAYANTNTNNTHTPNKARTPNTPHTRQHTRTYYDATATSTLCDTHTAHPRILQCSSCAALTLRYPTATSNWSSSPEPVELEVNDTLLTSSCNVCINDAYFFEHVHICKCQVRQAHESASRYREQLCDLITW